jgi:hypothetical protein
MSSAPKTTISTQAKNHTVAASKKASKKEEAAQAQHGRLCEAPCAQEGQRLRISSKTQKTLLIEQLKRWDSGLQRNQNISAEICKTSPSDG